MWLKLSIVAAVLLVGYVFWLRPLLKKNPKLSTLWDSETKFTTALRLKFAGLKQKTLGAVTIIALVAVQFADFITPVLGMVDTTPLTAQLPPWAWPLLTMAVIAGLQYCRKLSEKRAAAEAAKQ